MGTLQPSFADKFHPMVSVAVGTASSNNMVRSVRAKLAREKPIIVCISEKNNTIRITAVLPRIPKVATMKMMTVNAMESSVGPDDVVVMVTVG